MQSTKTLINRILVRVRLVLFINWVKNYSSQLSHYVTVHFSRPKSCWNQFLDVSCLTMFLPKCGHLNTVLHGKQRCFCHWIGGLTEPHNSVCLKKITNYFPSLKSLWRKDCSNIRGLLFNVNGMLYSAGVLCTQKNPISFGLCQAADKSAVHLLFAITDLCRPDIF